MAQTSQVEIDPNMPWAQWPEPEIFNTDLKALNAMVEDDMLVLKRRDGEGGEDTLGRFSTDSLQQVGWHTKFPGEFVGGLPTHLQAEIVNHRLDQAQQREFTVVAEDGVITNLAPGWRGLLPYRTTAQFTFNTLRNVYGDAEVDVHATHANGKMSCRILLPVEKPITPARGDVLQMGIEVLQCYGTTIEATLYARRLICTNGMTSDGEEFKWRQRSAGSVDHQLNWLQQGLMTATSRFDNLVQRSQLMAHTAFHGNPIDVLREHARAMRLPQRHVNGLVEAFNVEPGNTEWHLLNAFTRLATHGQLNRRTAQAIMRASGNWISDFDMVRARMPRPMAVAVGAEILETEPAS